MLSELRVENLVLIERAALRLGAGLNVLTGETGAGKTVLAGALDLLLGGRARSSQVRPGAAEAYVEGVFELDDALRARLGDAIAPDAEELVLARRVSAEGRSRAAINGRSCAVADLRDVAAELIAFYGQHEHRKLTLAGAQLELLDAACGAEHLSRRGACGDAHARVRELEQRLQELRELAGARERELDLLQFELAEIEEADPSEAEEDELLAARERLRHVEALRAAALGGAEVLAPEDGEGGALAALAAAGAGLDGVEHVDGELDELIVRYRALTIEAGDVAAELRRYGEALDADPGALDVAEERLGAIERLKRKHGGSIAAVLEHAARCRARRDELTSAEIASEAAKAELSEALAQRVALAAELHDARTATAPVLAGAVRARLDELAMEGAQFEIALEDRQPGPSGTDAVEFRIAANPGVAAAPLREIASGGELSRVMLALAAAVQEQGGAGAGGGAATVVFDEIDAGIGGVTARAVGEQLRALASGRQILCITHLPQIASLGARHFSIRKDTTVTPARTEVVAISDKEVVGEIVRMLGAGEDDVAARRHAKELLKAA